MAPPHTPPRVDWHLSRRPGRAHSRLARSLLAKSPKELQVFSQLWRILLEALSRLGYSQGLGL